MFSLKIVMNNPHVYVIGNLFPSTKYTSNVFGSPKTGILSIAMEKNKKFLSDNPSHLPADNLTRNNSNSTTHSSFSSNSFEPSNPHWYRNTWRTLFRSTMIFSETKNFFKQHSFSNSSLSIDWKPIFVEKI